MVTGIVKWFNPVKGYGFITPTQSVGQDVFVHHTYILGEGFRRLRKGQAVAFVMHWDKRGPHALETRPV